MQYMKHVCTPLSVIFMLKTSRQNILMIINTVLNIWLSNPVYPEKGGFPYFSVSFDTQKCQLLITSVYHCLDHSIMSIFLQYKYLNRSAGQKCIRTLQCYIFPPVHFQVQTEKVWNISKFSLKKLIFKQQCLWETKINTYPNCLEVLFL